jgi:2-polyprenyl-3-methyl-5-hydroxy-6-metoxy-1,4-benzoquinol methylase
MGTEFNIDQFDSIYPVGIENHYWNSAKNRIVSHALSNYLNTADILEVGCGRGVVVKYLLSKCYKVRGVELADIPIEDDLTSYIKSGTDVFSLDLQEYKQVDTILLCDVIEHLEFPDQFLKKLKSKFPSLKRFVITVPARQEIFSNYDTFNGHYRRYDIKSLLNDFKDIPGTAKKLSYSYHSLYIPAKILLNTKGEREVQIKAPKGFIVKLIHNILSRTLFIEYLILPSRWKGTSLLLEFELS